jgi:hypothetical protein
VSGLDGWAPAERAVVHHRDGDGLVTAETWLVEPGVDVGSLAERHAVLALSDGEWRTDPWQEVPVLGTPGGRERTVRGSDAAGHPREVVQRYVVRAGRAVCLTISAPTGQHAKRDEAMRIAEAVEVRGTTDIDQLTPSVRNGSGADFSAAAHAWRSGLQAEPSSVHVLATEECFAAAEHHGVTMLPGVDTTDWHAMPDGERELARSVAWRCLRARGYESDAGLREVLELAASHDLLLVVSPRGHDGPVRWYAARPDRSVQVERGAAPGQVQLSALDTAGLADLVLSASTTGEPYTASVVYRREGHVVGGEATWEAGSTRDEVLRRLADLLPGGDRATHSPA